MKYHVYNQRFLDPFTVRTTSKKKLWLHVLECSFVEFLKETKGWFFLGYFRTNKCATQMLAPTKICWKNNEVPTCKNPLASRMGKSPWFSPPIWGGLFLSFFSNPFQLPFLSQSNFRVHWFWEFRNLNFWGCCPWSHLQRCIDLYPKRVLLHSKDDDVVWLFKGFYHCIIFILCGYQWQYVWYSV